MGSWAAHRRVHGLEKMSEFRRCPPGYQETPESLLPRLHLFALWPAPTMHNPAGKHLALSSDCWQLLLLDNQSAGAVVHTEERSAATTVVWWPINIELSSLHQPWCMQCCLCYLQSLRKHVHPGEQQYICWTLRASCYDAIVLFWAGLMAGLGSASDQS